MFARSCYAPYCSFVFVVGANLELEAYSLWWWLSIFHYAVYIKNETIFRLVLLGESVNVLSVKIRMLVAGIFVVSFVFELIEIVALINADHWLLISEWERMLLLFSLMVEFCGVLLACWAYDDRKKIEKLWNVVFQSKSSNEQESWLMWHKKESRFLKHIIHQGHGDLRSLTSFRGD